MSGRKNDRHASRIAEDSAVQQIDSFVPQNLVQLMWACGTAGDDFIWGPSRGANSREMMIKWEVMSRMAGKESSIRICDLGFCMNPDGC
jgi:hypothetical protein